MEDAAFDFHNLLDLFVICWGDAHLIQAFHLLAYRAFCFWRRKQAEMPNAGTITDRHEWVYFYLKRYLMGLLRKQYSTKKEYSAGFRHPVFSSEALPCSHRWRLLHRSVVFNISAVWCMWTEMVFALGHGGPSLALMSHPRYFIASWANKSL